MFYDNQKYLNALSDQREILDNPVRAETFYGPNYQMGLAGIFDKLKSAVKKGTATVKKGTAAVKKAQAFYKKIIGPKGEVQVVEVPAGTPGATATPPAAGLPKWAIPAGIAGLIGIILLAKRKK